MSTEAVEITRTSRSNLALAFISLPPERRRDMATFYAFCRLVDDIGDEPGRSVEEKAAALADWKRALEESFDGEPHLAAEVRELIAKYRIPHNLPAEIITGVEMDLHPMPFETWKDLEKYCWRVASAVGLVSIEIFGYNNPQTRAYAVQLGLALQITNILRDVAQDFENGGRVYLPMEDIRRFGVQLEDVASHRHTPEFSALMEFEAQRASDYFQHAVKLLPVEDRRAMVAAEIMRKVYARLLRRMRSGGFRVLEKRYKLSKAEKTLTVARAWLWNALGR
jgi:phytoene synthase